MRFGLGLGVMFFVAMINIRWWYKLSWPIYFLGLTLLVIVEATGHVGMGAQRWIDLGIMKLQPSELMKIAVIMVLARYFHTSTPDDMRSIRHLILPVSLYLGLSGWVCCSRIWGRP